jgi:uncharacterized damage-inducible protein DinB
MEAAGSKVEERYGIALMVMSDWLGYQIGVWERWAAEGEGQWLTLPTGNPRHPTIGEMFKHAFTPLHRYASQVEGGDAVDDGQVSNSDWPALVDWAKRCQARHREACRKLKPGEGDRLVDFTTRSAGIVRVKVAEALSHAGMHSFWHLGGITHLLRQAGFEPPQRSDLILWAAGLVH